MIAQEIQDQWNKKNNTKINFVTGNEWVGGNLSYHLKSRPIWVGEILSDDKICFNENYKTTKFVESKFCISSKNKKVSE